MKKYYVLIQKLIRTGFLSVFSSNVINKIANFAYGFILVRVISKENYGSYAYANNIYSYFALFIGLGMASALLQVCSENGNDINSKKENYRFCYSVSWYVNILLSIIVIIFAIYIPLTISNSNFLLLLMGLLPLFTQFTPMFLNWLRSNMKNKQFARVNTFNTVAIVVCSIVGAVCVGTEGLIAGRYIAAILTILYSVKFQECFFPKIMGLKSICNYEYKTKIFSIAFALCISEALVQIIALIGVSVLGYYIPDESVIAAYKTATILPTALAFISNSVLLYAYPYFAKNKNDLRWTKRNYLYIMLGLVIISGIICFSGLVFSRNIIVLLFGEKYIDSIQSFKILMFAFFANSVLRIPAINLLITQMKLKLCTGVSVLGSILTIVFNIVFIPKYNSIGAALAQLSTTLIVGIVCTISYLIVIYRRENETKINKNLYSDT